jgi:predicted kinase
MAAPDTVASGSPESAHGRADRGASVNQIRIQVSDKMVMAVALSMAAAAMISSFWAIHEANIAEREARMLEYYTLEMDAKLISHGVKTPDEAVSRQLGERK